MTAELEGSGPGPAAGCGKRILVFGWGAAAERVLLELSACQAAGQELQCHCISHTSQADDCDLRLVCSKLGFTSALTDSDTEALEMATAFNPDLIISASYRKKIKKEVLDLTPDCVNFHPSLLPKHRGCWSGFWTIFEGDAETGVSCHRMVERFDEGKLLHVERLPVAADDTSASIYKKILPVTAACARAVLKQYFADGGRLAEGTVQTGDSSYHYRKLPFAGLVQPEWSEEQVERFLRAMHFPPFDGAAMVVKSEDGSGEEKVLIESMDQYRELRGRTTASAAAANGGGS